MQTLPIRYIRLALCLGAALSLLCCSTTRHLPEGETLYTGIRQTAVEGYHESGTARRALDEAEAALAYPPNNALFGSSSVRMPLPVGLWMYNAFVRKEGKTGKWLFDKLAAQPVFLTAVNPDVRVAIARNILREHGYFDASVSYEILPDAKDPRKAGLEYRIEMNHLYTYDSIRYVRSGATSDSLIQAARQESLLRAGAPFNVAVLEAERQRISSLLRTHGFYYHRPEFVVYQADTLISPGKIWLRVSRKPGAPPSAFTPYRVGERSVRLYGYNNEPPTDSIRYKDLTIHYEQKLRIRPAILYERFRIQTGDLYSENRQQQTQTLLANLSVFRYAEMQFTPRDTARRDAVLDLHINTVYDLPLDGELELRLTDKSNNLRGPGAIFSLTRRNLFRGGETLKIQVNGSYEWQTGNATANRLNSYEAGAGATLTLPFVMLPTFAHRGLLYPSHTAFRLYADALNRARFFRMLSFSGSVAYEFQPFPEHHHTFTPFRLTYNRLLSTTAEFNEITALNPALRMSLGNQFIPSLSYTYTYDDSSLDRSHHFWWEASLTEAGNLFSALYALAGEPWNKEGKELLGNPFAHFVKATAEMRYNYRLDRNHRIVARLMTGAIFSYGNARIPPFSEQFYTGGANSLRAFTIRTIGPGRFRPLQSGDKYAYIDQVGDLKLEANLEYRFRLVGDLYGAAFLDCGGIWLLRRDENRQGGLFSLPHLWNDLALGSGAGLRYDLDFIVVRFDVGVGLHLPYDTGRKGYYNIPRFSDALAFHLAVGYPF
ncbi:MAG: BamA/TamA family outer membrane protein [Tannerellaceae bacterium]|jgi:outer membrane protein assembly factor BamA|nr:BamA/TamA family outer membrane protein [Tannerellaceae bacterium]